MESQAHNSSDIKLEQDELFVTPKRVKIEEACKSVFELYLKGKYFDCLNQLEYFEAKGQINSNDERIKILRAGCWTFLGINHEEAVEMLNEIIQTSPENPQAHYALGLNFYLNGELEKCLEPLTLAISLTRSNQGSIERIQFYKDTALKVLCLLNKGNQRHNFSLYSFDNV
jgi:tetratricopeptide (TPR) repeat protein